MRPLTAMFCLVLTLGACGSEEPPGQDAGSTTSSTGASTTADEPGRQEDNQRLTADSTVNADGIGPLKAGMTLAEARASIQPEIELEGFEAFGGYCWMGRVSGLEEDFSLLFLSPDREKPVEDPDAGVLGRVSVYAEIESSPAQTQAGIGIGSTEQEVEAVYESGHAYETTPHFYVEGGKYIDVRGAKDEAIMLRFETDPEGKVTAIHGGLEDAVRLIEGCA